MNFDGGSIIFNGYFEMDRGLMGAALGGSTRGKVFMLPLFEVDSWENLI